MSVGSGWGHVARCHGAGLGHDLPQIAANEPTRHFLAANASIQSVTLAGLEQKAG